MPLFQSSSKKAVGKNIEAEMEAGKGRKPSIAIALDIKRRNSKKKKMAEGGAITAKDEPGASADLKDGRELHIAEGAKPSVKMELSELLESLSGNSIDAAMDEREMAMKKRMADGGEIEANNEDTGNPGEDSEDQMDTMQMARGGSVADAIMKKRKMMADGGEVDLQDLSDEQLNSEDDMSYDAAGKKTYYDDSQLSKQPEDSNEHGDERESGEEDEHDMIAKIRSKMKSKKMI